MVKHGKYLLRAVPFMLSCALLAGCQAPKVPDGGEDGTKPAATTVEDSGGESGTDDTADGTETTKDTEETTMSNEIGKTPQEDGLYLRIDPSVKGKVIGNKVEVDVIDGQLNFYTELDLNTVVFLKIEPIEG